MLPCGHHLTFPLAAYLSESGHGLAGDDLIVVKAGNEAQGLVLVLPSFQLPQDERSEYLHILQHRHKREGMDKQMIPRRH